MPTVAYIYMWWYAPQATTMGVGQHLGRLRDAQDHARDEAPDEEVHHDMHHEDRHEGNVAPDVAAHSFDDEDEGATC